jgi:hypothetical protein
MPPRAKHNCGSRDRNPATSDRRTTAITLDAANRGRLKLRASILAQNQSRWHTHRCCANRDVVKYHCIGSAGRCGCSPVGSERPHDAPHPLPNRGIKVGLLPRPEQRRMRARHVLGRSAVAEVERRPTTCGALRRRRHLTTRFVGAAGTASACVCP